MPSTNADSRGRQVELGRAPGPSAATASVSRAGRARRRRAARPRPRGARPRARRELVGGSGVEASRPRGRGPLRRPLDAGSGSSRTALAAARAPGVLVDAASQRRPTALVGKAGPERARPGRRSRPRRGGPTASRRGVVAGALGGCPAREGVRRRRCGAGAPPSLVARGQRRVHVGVPRPAGFELGGHLATRRRSRARCVERCQPRRSAPRPARPLAPGRPALPPRRPLAPRDAVVRGRRGQVQRLEVVASPRGAAAPRAAWVSRSRASPHRACSSNSASSSRLRSAFSAAASGASTAAVARCGWCSEPHTGQLPPPTASRPASSAAMPSSRRLLERDELLDQAQARGDDRSEVELRARPGRCERPGGGGRRRDDGGRRLGAAWLAREPGLRCPRRRLETAATTCASPSRGPRRRRASSGPVASRGGRRGALALAWQQSPGRGRGVDGQPRQQAGHRVVGERLGCEPERRGGRRARCTGRSSLRGVVPRRGPRRAIRCRGRTARARPACARARARWALISVSRARSAPRSRAAEAYRLRCSAAARAASSSPRAGCSATRCAGNGGGQRAGEVAAAEDVSSALQGSGDGLGRGHADASAASLTR